MRRIAATILLIPLLFGCASTKVYNLKNCRIPEHAPNGLPSVNAKWADFDTLFTKYYLPIDWDPKKYISKRNLIILRTSESNQRMFQFLFKENWGEEKKPESELSPQKKVRKMAEIKPKSRASFSNTYVWNGKELKPKSGATFENTWEFNGRELKPKSGASFSNTYEWSGKELKPKSGASFSNTYVWDGKELKPKSGAKFENTWVFNGREWKPKSGASFSNTFEVSGNIPVPVCALVVLALM